MAASRATRLSGSAAGNAAADHARNCERLAADLARAKAEGGGIGLDKSTSNLFRHRDGAHRRNIGVRHFNRVLEVDAGRMMASVEGMTTYEELVDATLAHGLLPTVVPQLKTITIGGAVSGVGIESSSFRFGLVHETIEEMEILLGDGSIVVCSRTREPELFYGFPNSYGTLGYALRLTVRLIPAKRYVHLTHTRHTDAHEYFRTVSETCARKDIDYLDGTVFGLDELYLTEASLTDEAPRVSDYTYLKIYYKSIARKQEDWLTSRNYIWRWDTDWFWCSKHFYVQSALARLLATRRFLNSRTYQRVMRWSHRMRPASDGTESVIQDVDIPIANAPQFLGFLDAEIGIKPIWICPFRAFDPEVTYDLYALDPRKLYINFGFWDVVPSSREDGYFNRKVEEMALKLDGKKGLYSTSYYDRETFWRIYNKPRYDELKRRYDPGGVFPDLYDKCVERK